MYHTGQISIVKEILVFILISSLVIKHYHQVTNGGLLHSDIDASNTEFFVCLFLYRNLIYRTKIENVEGIRFGCDF